MSGSIIDPSTINVYRNLDNIQVDHKLNWSSAWTNLRHVHPMNATIPVGGQSTGSAQFRQRYGQVKQPTSGSISSVSRLNIDRHWIRMTVSPHTDDDVFWQGRVKNEKVEVHGNPLLLNDSGVQIFTAYDGTDLLRQRSIHATVFEGPTVPGDLLVIDWLMPIGVDRFRGNRGRTKIFDAFGDQDNYWFGIWGDEWLVKDFVEMLIIGYMNSHNDQPKWTLNLDDFETDVADEAARDALPSPDIGDRAYVRSEDRCDEWNGATWTEGVSCSPMFRKASWRPSSDSTTVWKAFLDVIEKQAGLNFVVYPTVLGFEMKIFSLAYADVTVGTTELQANPNTVTIDAQSTVDGKQIIIERSMVDVYDTVRIVGPRIVSCASFDIDSGSLVNGWSAAWQTAYENSVAGTPAEKDKFRQHDQFRQCFQCFKVTDAVANYPIGSVPDVDANGNLTTGPAILQSRFRSTLPNLPLKEGFDYSTDPPTDNSFDLERTPFLPPLFIIQNLNGEWVKAEDAGMSVHVLNDDLGVQVSNRLPHRVAEGTFGGITDEPSEYDARKAFATLAWETDQKIVLVRGAASPFVSANGVRTLDYSQETVAWYLAPNTVIGINGDGNLIRSPNVGTSLQNDVLFLEQKAVGAEARYLQNRYRAKITLAGFWPWSSLIGQIVQVTNASTQISDAKSIITAITWQFERDFETRIRTGFFPINL